ncbi:MAG TPA: glycosyltransferase [Anaerolineae bacterium]|nr:glycosyltransferase [Anaerolineae bacterium]
MDALLISVVIPVYNGGAAFHQCLEALAQSYYPHWECIVVDDGSTDGSADVAASFGYHVLHTSHSRSGPAVARNLGARAAQGEILFFTDADVALHPNSLSIAAATLSGSPQVDACFGSYDDEPSDPGFLSQYKNLLHHYVHQRASTEASTFWSGCGAIRRDVFQAVGGYRETFAEPSIEDIELGYRLRKAGYHIRLEKRLQAKHLKRWTPGSLLRSDFFHRGIPWTRLIWQQRWFFNDLNLQRGDRLSVMILYLLLASLFVSVRWPRWVGLSALLAWLLLWLNLPLYRFFARKRGWRFALMTIPWHWFYYFYSGLAFVVGTAQYFVARFRSHPRFHVM